MMNNRRSETSTTLLLLIFGVFIHLPSNVIAQGAAGLGVNVPSSIHLSAGVLHAPPFGVAEEQRDGTVTYGGFELELLRRMQVFAKEDNVTLTVDLSPLPTHYGEALNLVANDCNTTENPNALADCQQFDLIVGDYYCNPQRSVRVDFTPSWLRTTMSTVKYVDKSPGSKDYTTLTQASADQATVCVPDGTYLQTVVMAKFPKAEYIKCETQDQCIDWLKQEKCVLYAQDELILRYYQSQDPSLEVTREHFNTQYLVWPLKYDLPTVTTILLKKWIYTAVSNATLDDLYFTYFQKALCPIGTAGEDCELPCDPNHGQADARGKCVCESVKWTGEDCSIEVEEEVNLIPTSLKWIAYGMFGLNAGIMFICGLWLLWQKDSPQVRVSQPSFLVLVLLGCLISSSTILVMGQEDGGDGPVHACMAIPWLYSVGFSITFGTLFAKIRRVYLIFMNAAQNKRGVEARKNSVTFRETLSFIGFVLAVDVFILTIWTVVDPLVWERTVLAADQFGAPLESEGFCRSDHWVAFAAVIATLHLTLLGVACYMCYVARDIPTKFSEGKYLAIAMISNLQIFVVGVPILIILGPDPQTSFFVRSVIIWMNDLAVVTLIFGNLMFSVHFEAGDSQTNVKSAVDQVIHRYSTHQSNNLRKSSSGEKHGASTSFQQSRSQAGDPEAPIKSSSHRRSKSGTLRSSTHSTRQGSRVTSRSGVSWAETNESAKEFGGDEEEEDPLSPPPQDAFSKPVDVLKSNRASWGAVNFSTYERPGASQNDTSEEHMDEEDDPLQPSEQESLPEDEPTPRPSLPPPNLPKQRPTHMSYAESRISKLRSSHAQVLAERKSVRASRGSNAGQSSGRADPEGTDSTLGSNNSPTAPFRR